MARCEFLRPGYSAFISAGLRNLVSPQPSLRNTDEELLLPRPHDQPLRSAIHMPRLAERRWIFQQDWMIFVSSSLSFLLTYSNMHAADPLTACLMMGIWLLAYFCNSKRSLEFVGETPPIENRTACTKSSTIDLENPISHSAYRQPAACGVLLQLWCDVLPRHPHDLMLLCSSYGYSFCKYSQLNLFASLLDVLTQLQALSFAIVHVWAVLAYYARSTFHYSHPSNSWAPGLARALLKHCQSSGGAECHFFACLCRSSGQGVAGGTLPPGMSAQKAPDIIHMLWFCNCHFKLPSCYESSHSLVAILEYMS
jgi:hypothetical protein